MARFIDWESAETHFLLNPRCPEEEQAVFSHLQKQLAHLRAHVLIASSGTSGKRKLVALSKDAMLSSAKAVNAYLESTSADVWALALPTFHVGGLGIFARAHLSGARVIDLRHPSWDAHTFCTGLNRERATLASLVPTQCHDILVAGLQAPTSLRAVIVGGGALPYQSYCSLRELGWPLLPSYGLTECSSQVATAPLDSLRSSECPRLHLLPHVRARISVLGCLDIASDALLSATAIWNEALQSVELFDPKRDGWYSTEDRAQLDGAQIIFLGREGDVIKIGGESVDLQLLQQRVEVLRAKLHLRGDAALLPVADQRLGSVLHLALSPKDLSDEEVARMVDAYNCAVLPFERARAVHRVEKIPRTALGKVITTRIFP